MKLEQDLLFADHYKLKRKIGRGGFSEVWLAEDKYTHLQIAIKVYAPEGGMDEQGVETFSSEIAHVYNLNHSNILKPQHFDVWQNMPYLVLPFCSNGSCMKSMGKMDEQQVWDLIGQIGSGLSYLHKNNVIHQDIKPDNILINAQGDYVLTDFGISTHTRSTIRHIESSSEIEDPSAGTRPYMAPERFGKDKTPVKASDIWALGATIFELMTGDVPFGDGMLPGGLLQKNGTQLPDMPYQYSEELRCFVAQMLAVEPWDRPTAAQLVKVANDPEHKFGQDLSKTKPQSSGKKKVPKPKEIKPKNKLWVALSALLLIGVGIGLWLSLRTTFLLVNGEKERVIKSLMAGGGEYEGFVVTDGRKFKLKDVPVWMSVEYPDTKKFVLHYSKNSSKAVRVATLKVVSGRKEVELRLSQPFRQATYVQLNGQYAITAKCNMDGGSLRYAVTTDGEDWKVVSQPEWCKVSREDNTLVLSFDANQTDKTRDGSVQVRADGCTAKIKLSQISKTRYEQDKRSRELKAQQEREMEEKAYMNITKVEFKNEDKDDNVISDWGKPLMSDKMRYLMSKIYYTGLDETKSHSIKLYFRVYLPGNESYDTGSNSPTGYTYSKDVTIDPGSHWLSLSGWGTDNSSVYPAGVGKLEIWYNGKKIYTTYYSVAAASSSSSYSSSSSSSSTELKAWMTNLLGLSSYPIKTSSVNTIANKIKSDYNPNASKTKSYVSASLQGPKLFSVACTYVYFMVADNYESSTVHYNFKCSSSSAASQLRAKIKSELQRNSITFKDSDGEDTNYKDTYLFGVKYGYMIIGGKDNTVELRFKIYR